MPIKIEEQTFSKSKIKNFIKKNQELLSNKTYLNYGGFFYRFLLEEFEKLGEQIGLHEVENALKSAKKRYDELDSAKYRILNTLNFCKYIFNETPDLVAIFAQAMNINIQTDLYEVEQQLTKKIRNIFLKK